MAAAQQYLSFDVRSFLDELETSARSRLRLVPLNHLEAAAQDFSRFRLAQRTLAQ
jgi:hypothetical protein